MGKTVKNFSNRLLTDEEIFEATRQQIEFPNNNGYSTNYKSAFSEAVELFTESKQGNPDNCRILVFSLLMG